MNGRAQFDAGEIRNHAITETNKQKTIKTNKQTNSKRYIHILPIGMRS